MARLGIHFALTEELAEHVNVLGSTEEFVDALEANYDALSQEGWTETYSGTWDTLHRSLTNGKLEHGDDPASLCILGSGEYPLGNDEWIVNVLEPEEVGEVAEFLADIGAAQLRRGYERIDPATYGFEKSEEDFRCACGEFARLKAFFQRAAESEFWVVFIADQ
jgi:hypothetical protein